MSKWVKIILIIFVLIGCIVMSGLLLSKIGDVRRLNGATTNNATYKCDSGWTLNKSTKKCTKVENVKEECVSGYTYSSKYKVCYKTAARKVSNYYCSTSTDKLKNLSGLGYVCTRTSTKGCNSYKTNGITVTKKSDKCTLTKNATKISNTITLTFCMGTSGNTNTCNSSMKKQVSGLKGSKFTFPTEVKGVKASKWKDSNGNVYYPGKKYTVNKSTTYIMVQTNTTGWINTGSDYMYITKVSGSYINKTNAWQDNCYLGSDGTVQRGLQKIGNVWYNLIVTGNNAKPTCKSYKYTWHCDKKKGAYWYGYNSTYYARNTSLNISNATYKFDSNGYCTGTNCHNEKCK